MVKSLIDAVQGLDPTEPCVVVLFTSNGAKQEEYALAAEHMRRQGFDIRVVPSWKMTADETVHHNAPEDTGTVLGNSKQKLSESIATLERMGDEKINEARARLGIDNATKV